MRRRLLGPIVLTAVLVSCEFGEIEIPEGDPMVVVHAVMRPDLERQWVLVEQTLTGSAFADDTLGSLIPGDTPPIPVTGATVTVTNLTLPTDPCGDVLLTENAAVSGNRRSLGLYWGPRDCPTMRAGDTLALRVVTADGSVVTGRTEVVGAERMVLRVNDDSVIVGAKRMVLRDNGDTVFVPVPALTFNRDADTLEAEVFPVAGRALQVEIAHPDTMGFLDPAFLFFVDSTAMTVPWDLVNFFDEFFDDDSTSSDAPSSVFVAGRRHTVTVALMDDHFFDFQRTANMQLSGRGFVNHLEGGMGVFGNIVTAAHELRVVSALDDDREGGYRMTGLVAGVAVDITLELYVAAADEDTTSMAAFVQGDWVHGALDSSADGFFRGSEMTLSIYQLGPAGVSAVLLSGPFSTSGSFTLTAYDRQLDELGTVSVARN